MCRHNRCDQLTIIVYNSFERLLAIFFFLINDKQSNIFLSLFKLYIYIFIVLFWFFFLMPTWSKMNVPS